MHKYLRVGSAAFAAASLSLLGTTALAYGPSQGNSTGSVSPSSTTPGGSVTFTATFQDQNGQAVLGAAVTFSEQSGPAGCHPTFNPTSSTTNSAGQASTTVTLPTGCSGSYVLAASTAGATVTATVVEAAAASNAFPATSAAAPAAAAGSSLPIIALLFGLALVVIGGAAQVLKRR